MIDIIFCITAAVAIISALLTVSAHNVVHALLYLVTMMLAIALIFFLLGSPFAAALQIIVYAGAVMVLFVFVTMMLHQGERSLVAERQLFNPKVAKGPLILSMLLVIELTMISLGSVGLHQEILTSPLPVEQTVKQLAIQLFGSYRVLVVLAAIMLLTALVSAIHITKQGNKSHSKSSSSTEFTPDVSVNYITKQGSIPHSATDTEAKPIHKSGSTKDPDTTAELAHGSDSIDLTADVSVNYITQQASIPHSPSTQTQTQDTEAEQALNLNNTELTPNEIEPSLSLTSKGGGGHR
ncbi:NADH-quinone oxidoreductase subunit J family protein [Shewanella violacea]|uniref:NADH-quinone oxidoreductase subunit J n=1 Tax=Shewanella violacea (strain JCM 10179 / CIP 106290 / LMG 19151 / DSS12) TaxID=637905 RepID=D4ZIV8_SHEVD|nr:NADH-quinone oxidoreductase subunit J [Shewanella violacea]BAJ01607.1 NADH dehydrogenase I, J subunit [Shewanella violacea DSS12]